MARAMYGDVLKVRAIMKNKIGVWHYGVLTDRNTVIDHGPDGTWERTFLEFTGGGKVYFQRHSNPHLSREQVVSRARSLIGKLEYSALVRNCEHFVNLCRRGKASSKQVRNTVLGVAFGGLTLYGLAQLFKSE